MGGKFRVELNLRVPQTRVLTVTLLTSNFGAPGRLRSYGNTGLQIQSSRLLWHRGLFGQPINEIARRPAFLQVLSGRGEIARRSSKVRFPKPAGSLFPYTSIKSNFSYYLNYSHYSRTRLVEHSCYAIPYKARSPISGLRFINKNSIDTY